MDLTIVERLACPNDHELTPLVVRADAVANGALERGILGCPSCTSEWVVDRGVAAFGPRAALSARDADPAVLAALLDLTEPGRIIIADGLAGGACTALARDYGALVLTLDPADDGAYAAVVDGAQRVPLAAHAARGAVLMRVERSAAFAESVVRGLAPRSRMVASLVVPVPSGVNEMARDDMLWVGACEDVSAPVALRRSSR